MGGTLRFDVVKVRELVCKLAPDAKVAIVGDRGVYLMSFGEPCEDSGAGRTVVYASGCHPDKDAGWYELKHDVFGGDDGADEVGTANEIRRMCDQADKYIIVKFTATTIYISADRGKNIAPGVDYSVLPAELRAKYALKE